MKRILALALAAVMMGTCYAQSIAIRQPVEGSKIREVTNILIPSRGIPASSYIGIVVNGKFIEAVSPETVKSDYIYKLDTKKLNLPDGPATIEAILYLDLGDDRPAQVIGRTSVNVTIDNSSITIPPAGINLKYKYHPGRELKYDFSSDTSISQISQAEALLGSRGFEQPREHDNFRFMEAIDDAYRNGDGMVRIQGLPDKDRNYGFMRLSSEGNTVRKVDNQEMAPLYLRLTDKGREVFGTSPAYFGFEGLSGHTTNFQLFLSLPTPILPTKLVKPGDVWQGAFSIPSRFNTSPDGHISTIIPARGTFEAVEYMHGVACARIRTSIQAGASDLRSLNNLGFDQGQNQSLKLDSIVWLGLKSGVIERQQIDLSQEALVQGTGVPNSGPGTGGRTPGGAGNGDSGAPGQAGAAFNVPILDPRVDGAGNFLLFNVPQDFAGQQGGPPGLPGVPGQDPRNQDPRSRGFGGPPGQNGGPPAGFGQPNGQQPQRVGKQIIRISLTAIIDLEK